MTAFEVLLGLIVAVAGGGVLVAFGAVTVGVEKDRAFDDEVDVDGPRVVREDPVPGYWEQPPRRFSQGGVIR